MQRDQAHRTNELLERIAIALEKNNKKESIHPVDKLQGVTHADVHNAKYNNDIPGFEGTLDALDNLYQPTSSNPDPAGYGKAMQDIYDNSTEDEYTYETDLQGIRVDSDHDIRSTAQYYTEILNNTSHTYEGDNLNTKKDCILDYVTNEFGALGARYTDIIKFAYYLGSPNALKYTSADRGYYSCAFNTRFGGHLIQGGKDCLVKGINNEGDERYFAFSFVEQATDYYKYVDNRSAR